MDKQKKRQEKRKIKGKKIPEELLRNRTALLTQELPR